MGHDKNTPITNMSRLSPEGLELASSFALNCEAVLYLVDHDSVFLCLVWLIPHESNHRPCSSLKREREREKKRDDGVMSGGLEQSRGDIHLDPLLDNFISPALQIRDPPIFHGASFGVPFPE